MILVCITGGCDAIPVVSTWGLAAMTLVLLVAATLVFRRVRAKGGIVHARVAMRDAG